MASFGPARSGAATRSDTPMNKSAPPILITSAGIPVRDNQNSITAGPRGPLLVQDSRLIKRLTHH